MKDSAVKRKIGVGFHEPSGPIDPNQKTRYKKQRAGAATRSPKPSSSGSAFPFPQYLPSALSITRVLSTKHMDDARHGTGEGYARQTSLDKHDAESSLLRTDGTVLRLTPSARPRSERLHGEFLGNPLPSSWSPRKGRRWSR
jgi:hypothetical protein